MTSRAVAEWIGKTPDARIPDRVKLRIWTREHGRCHITGRKIRPGDAYEFEHVIAICNGGEHRESNIALALTAEHKAKTAADVAEKAKVDRLRKRQAGIKTSRGRPLAGTKASGLRKRMSGQVERWP